MKHVADNSAESQQETPPETVTPTKAALIKRLRLARVRTARIKKTLNRERQTNSKPLNRSQQEIKHLISGAAKYLPKVSLGFLGVSFECQNVVRKANDGKMLTGCFLRQFTIKVPKHTSS